MISISSPPPPAYPLKLALYPLHHLLIHPHTHSQNSGKPCVCGPLLHRFLITPVTYPSPHMSHNSCHLYRSPYPHISHNFPHLTKIPLLHICKAHCRQQCLDVEIASVLDGGTSAIIGGQAGAAACEPVADRPLISAAYEKRCGQRA